MMKKLKVVSFMFVFMLFSVNVHAQETHKSGVDSLIKEVKRSESEQSVNKIFEKYDDKTKSEYLTMKTEEANKLISASQNGFQLEDSDYYLKEYKSFDGTDIIVELKDESDELQKPRIQTRGAVVGGGSSKDVIKEYGKRRFTATYSNGVSFKFSVVNRYTANNLGLTFTSVSTEGSYFRLGSWSASKLIPDKYAKLTGHDIDSLVVFKYSSGVPGTPIKVAGSIYFRSYIKIKRWDVRKDYMVLTQKYKYNIYS